MKEQVKYLLKHNVILLTAYQIIGSLMINLLGCLVRIDDSVVLFTANSGGYNDSPRELYRAMKNHPGFRLKKMVWALDDIEKFDEELNDAFIVKLDSLQYFLVALKAKYWIASVNIERGLHFKKRDTIFLNTWHGPAINKMGNGVKSRNDFDCSNVDIFCYSGEYERSILIEDMNVRDKSLFPSGLPKNDVLFHPDHERICAVRHHYKIDDCKKIILYAPTWRDSANLTADYSFKPPISWEKWKTALQNDYVMLVRMHPNTTYFITENGADFFIDCSDYPDVNDLLMAADALISDYSSIILDYCVLDRPIFCYGYDYDEYCEKRGFYYDLEKELPNGVARTEDELLEQIVSIDHEEQSRKTKEFHSAYIEYGGNATTMCVNALMEVDFR